MSNVINTKSDARYETSAAWAETEASNAKLAKQVEKNAGTLHNAAEDAANKAQFKSPTGAVDRLEDGLSKQTNAAASEGAANVQGYAQQAKDLATSAVNTVQSNLPSTNVNNGGNGGILSNLASSAGVAAATTKEYLVAAQNAAAPVAASAYSAGAAAVESARTTAAPYVQSATDSVSRALSGSEPQPETSDSAARKTTSLEFGQHVVDSPYPSTTTTQNSKAGGL
ncbi:hypothetical protein QCA50_002352 [Cerrena zonata]|uniref:Uncharacterized protein n=1 Tax=Cerrena zonata TaxID=2478898 RepID=A0AAW0GT87_9APHY